jgi:hypothetical protein
VSHVFLDKDDKPVKVVTVAEGELVEAPGRAAVKAMFAKAFGANQRADKARGNDKYYGKFRGKYAKKHGLNPKKAIEQGARVAPPKNGKDYDRARRRGESVQAPKNKPQVTEGKGKGKAPAPAPKKGKSTVESRSAGMKVNANLVNATLTLLRSPYSEDVLKAMRVVNEQASGWPEKAKVLLVKQLDKLHDVVAESETGLRDLIRESIAHLLDLEVPAKPAAASSSAPNKSSPADKPVGESAGKPEDEAAKRRALADSRKPTQESVKRIKALESEVARLESTVTKQKAVIETMRRLHNESMVTAKVTELCLTHPVLEKVRAKLAACPSAEDVVVEANSYLTFVGEPIAEHEKPASVVGESASAVGKTTVASFGNGGELPTSGPLNEDLSLLVGGAKAPAGSSSRVAAHRRRNRGGR